MVSDTPRHDNRAWQVWKGRTRAPALACQTALEGAGWLKNQGRITEKAFRKYVNQSRPFQIHLADGREIRVPHDEHISVQPGGRMFLLWLRDGGFELFNLTMVTSVKSGAKE
jgi:hypothetical protein